MIYKLRLQMIMEKLNMKWQIKGKEEKYKKGFLFSFFCGKMKYSKVQGSAQRRKKSGTKFKKMVK